MGTSTIARKKNNEKTTKNELLIFARFDSLYSVLFWWWNAERCPTVGPCISTSQDIGGSVVWGSRELTSFRDALSGRISKDALMGTFDSHLDEPLKKKTSSPSCDWTVLQPFFPFYVTRTLSPACYGQHVREQWGKYRIPREKISLLSDAISGPMWKVSHRHILNGKESVQKGAGFLTRRWFHVLRAVTLLSFAKSVETEIPFFLNAFLRTKYRWAVFMSITASIHGLVFMSPTIRVGTNNNDACDIHSHLRVKTLSTYLLKRVAEMCLLWIL